MRHLLIGITALAAATSLGALAQEQNEATVVRGETIVITAPAVGGYVTEQDAVLIRDATRALERDEATKSALVSLVANHGDLTVVGTTMDVAQSSRVIMKLKDVAGAKKVYAFIEPMTGDSQ